MKGIILAGGSGTRLYPITYAVSKQLLPVYDKPMIYYPLSVLMLAGIEEVLIISTPSDLSLFEKLLGDGSKLGMKFTYKMQEKPRGLADSFIVGKEFIGSSSVVLILGDNIFYGQGMVDVLNKSREIVKISDNAVIFGYYVKDPSVYGVVEIGESEKALSIEEKPENPKSHYAVPGLYFYPNNVIEKAENTKPSARGEIEITSINNDYMEEKKLNVHILGRGTAWLDTGSYDSLLDAGNYVEAIQKRQGLYIACIEEIAYRNKWITNSDLLKLAEASKTEYGNYLRYIAEEVEA